MALPDQLVAYYALEEKFEEGIHAVNSVPPNAHPLTHNPTIPGGVPQSITGKVAKGLQIVGDAYLAAPDAAQFRLGKDKTIAFWFRAEPGFSTAVMIEKASEYRFEFAESTGRLAVLGFAGFVQHSTVLALGQWHLVVFTYDFSAGLAHLRLNSGLQESGLITSTVGASGVAINASSGSFDIDELGFWDRILTAAEQDELYNDGDGITYSDITALTASANCRTLECCDDNPADYVSQGGVGLGYDSACEPLPKVMFEPVSGTRLILPSLVTLRSDNPEAVIHYTTDGSAPDRNSPVYSTPLTVSAPADLIRAIAIVDGCPEGPEATAQYQQWTPAAHFTYGCGTVDKSGQWGAFAADGNTDYNWELQIQFSAITGVKEFQVLQLFPDGTFTGAAWSTKEFIYPWESDATKEHRAFPLVMWNPDDSGAQVNVAYVDDFSVAHGTFAIGPHIRTFYGSPWTSLPATHLFKLKIVFQDGSILERLVDSTCDALPAALCPVPDFTSMTPACGPPMRIDLTFALGIGTFHVISKKVTGTSTWTVIQAANVVSNPQTYQDTAVVAGETYDYTLANVPAGCATFRAGPIHQVTAIPDPTVSISASPTTIDSGASSTLAWNSNNISGNVTIAPTVGVQPGNVAGNQVVSPAVTTTYTIAGANACGTQASAQVTVIVIPPATCGAFPPDIIGIQGYTGLLFIQAINGGACPALDPADPNDPDWVGYLVRTGVGLCDYSLPGTQRAFLGPFRRRLSLSTFLRMSGGSWIFELWSSIAGVDTLAWRGTKATGDSPVGIYTRTSGCAVNPVAITIAELATATCGPTQPGNVAISGYVDNFFVGAFGGCPSLAVDVSPAWDGSMSYRPWVGPCQFLTDYSVSTFIVNGGGRRVLTRAVVSIIGSRWVLRILGYQGGDIVVWEGEKSSGDTPVGSYVRTTGCDSTIPQLTLVAV